MKWQELTTNQIQNIDKNIPVILSVAAVEQHGAHLPLGTDSIIGQHFLDQIENSISEEVLILPLISYGYSRHHMGMSGSITIEHDTLLNYCGDLIDSICEHGFKNILVLNSHGGNQGVCQILMEQKGHKWSDCNIAFSSWWRLSGSELVALNKSGFLGTGHAGEFETSLLELICPHLIQRDAVETGGNIEIVSNMPTWAQSDMFKGSRVSMYRDIIQQTRNGVFGEPNAATAETGQKISEIVTQQIITIVKDLRTLKR